MFMLVPAICNHVTNANRQCSFEFSKKSCKRRVYFSFFTSTRCACVHDLRSLFLTLYRLDLEIIMGVIIIIANFTLFFFCPFNNLRKPKITVHRHIFLNCVCKAENIQKKTVFFFVEKELFSRCLNDLQYWQNISENSKNKILKKHHAVTNLIVVTARVFR